MNQVIASNWDWNRKFKATMTVDAIFNAGKYRDGILVCSSILDGANIMANTTLDRLRIVIDKADSSTNGSDAATPDETTMHTVADLK
jgi:hypothetical protein